MPKIALSTAEIQIASMVGIQRQIEDIKWNNHEKLGEKKELAWQRHIEGALSECALAKYLGVYWNKRPHNEPDVGDVDVRATHYLNGKLRIDLKDKDDKKYYLLTGLNGEYIIRGWMYGRDGKNQKYWTTLDPDRPPCFWIPQSDLNNDF
jgi:hypothetical protein